MREPPQTDISPPADPPPPIDQRLWPTVLVLTAWAGIVSAVIVAAGGFDDPRPWCNGWVRLLTVGATWAALVWAVVTIYPRRAQRLKMAVAVSLAAHSLLAVALHWTQIEFHALPVPPQAELPARDDVATELVLPEYVRDPERGRRQQELFERPVATGQPVASANVVSRRPAQLDDVTGARQPPAALLAESPPTIPPPQLRRPTLEAAAVAAAPTATAQRRRGTTRVSLPRATVAMPESVVQARSTAPDEVVSAPSIPTLKRTMPSLVAPMISAAEPPSVIGPADRPAPRVAPRPVEHQPSGSFATLPALPAREPRLAMLPAPGIGIGRGHPRAPGTDQLPRVPGRRRPAPAYANRVRATQRRDDGSSPARPAPTEIDAAIALGLDFLAGIQLEDGRWKLDYLGSAVAAGAEPVNIEADAAATGMALLAFLGAGHDHLDGRYGRVVHDGLDYLVRIQNEAGALCPEEGHTEGQVARFYGHGIATLALCEAYGMTGDPRLHQPAQRAIDYLVETQHEEYGGWRYVPGTNTDLSVSGWQLIALRSGRLAGLAVPPETIERIRVCLERCRDEDRGGALFRYNPWASPTDPITRHGREPSTVMTSVGLLMQLYLDVDPADARVERAAEHLLANLPQAGDAPAVAPTGTLGNPQRDTYYWYYGTQAMYHLGGEYWAAWRGRLEPLLVDSQLTTGPAAGSWNPLHPVPDKWAAYGGRLYVTALNLLSLEADYRHLPLDDPAPPRIADRP